MYDSLKSLSNLLFRAATAHSAVLNTPHIYDIIGVLAEFWDVRLKFGRNLRGRMRPQPSKRIDFSCGQYPVKSNIPT